MLIKLSLQSFLFSTQTQFASVNLHKLHKIYRKIDKEYYFKIIQQTSASFSGKFMRQPFKVCYEKLKPLFVENQLVWISHYTYAPLYPKSVAQLA